LIRTIVTGGSGFIGYHLADYLSRKEDVEVTVIDNHARGSADEMFCELTARKNVVYLNADMTKTDFYKQLTGKYDYIYHLAAINGTKNFYEQPYKVFQANILTLMNMLQLRRVPLLILFGDICGDMQLLLGGTSGIYTQPRRHPAGN